jgi:oligoendopeptidase F
MLTSTPMVGPAFAADSAVVWDLTVLYADAGEWERERASLAEEIPGLAAYQGSLGQGPAALAEVLERNSALRLRLARLSSYANLQGDEDLRVAEGQERRQRVQQLWVSFSSANSYLNPEILSLGDDRVREYLGAEPRLEPYRFSLENLLRLRPHTLTSEAERVISGAGLMAGASSQAYSMLTNADIRWPKVTLSTGEEVTLDNQGYTKSREAPNREDRKLVFDAFWSAHQDFERTFGVTYAGAVNRDIFYARARNHPNSLASTLASNAIPESVYRSLVAEANATLPTLHRYFRLRGQMLGVDQMRYYDIYPSLVELDRPFSLAEGKRLTIESARPLGEEYVRQLTEGLNSAWMHAYPQTGKRSGAYMSGSVYDVHPFVLMNYQDNYSSVTTLAHEWGHAMHSVLANQNQPYPTAGYPLFTAEIAAIVNELLLFEYMLSEAQGDDERLFYLGAALEGIRGTFYRQTMFAEFELAAHEIVERGGALSGANLTRLYGDLLKRYHGHDQGVVVIDDLYTREWAFIPHFYNGYYVYQYATSMAAANLFVDRILAGEPGAVETYLNVLRAGGSRHPYELVRGAGVDLASPEPYQATARRMERIMDQMEAILAKRKN